MENIKINPLKYQNIQCQCGCETFVQAYILKRIPGIVAGTGSDDQILDLPVYICSKCGEILDDYKQVYKLGKYAEEETAKSDKPADYTKTKSGLIL